MQHLRSQLHRLLTWSERYTKTDMVYLTKGGSSLVMGQIVSSLTSFLLAVAFANLFPKEAYGIYRYILSVVGIAGAFSLTGMDTAVSQAVARGLDGTLHTSYTTMFRWTMGTALLTVLAAGYYFAQGNSTLGWGLVIAAITMPLLKSALLFNGFLVGKKDFGRKVRYGFVYDLLPGAVIVFSLLYTNNPLVVLGMYFGAHTLTAYALYRRTRAVYPPTAASEESTTTFSLHLSAMNILGAISFQIDKVLMFHYLGAVPLAAYSFALAIPQQIRQLQKHIAALVLPKFSSQPFESIRRAIGRKTFLLFAVMAGITALYILAAPAVFRLFFPQYIESVFYSQLFSLVLLASPSVFYKQALTAHRKTKALYIVNMCIPFIKILLLFSFIPKFGIVGGVLAFLVTEALGTILSIAAFYYTARKDRRIKAI